MTNSKLNVINVQNKSEWGNRFCKELDYLIRVSKDLKAEMLVFFSDNAVEIISDCIKRGNVKHVLISNDENNAVEIAAELSRKFKEINIHILNINDRKD